MKLILKNQTCFTELSVLYSGKTYCIKKNEQFELGVDSTNIELDVIVPEKNEVIVNWLFALIDGFFSEENIICSFNCNFKIDLCLIDDVSEIIFKNLYARDDKNGYIYNSLFVQTQNFKILNMKYRLFNTDKTRKKAMLYLIFITSWLPVLLFLLYQFLISGSVSMLVAFFVILIVFSIPNWKKANKTKIYFNDKKATEILVKEYERLKSNEWNPNIRPKNCIDKTIFKILDSIFGKKE